MGEADRPGDLCEISLLGGFGFSIAGRVRRGLSLGSQRLLALLALTDRAVARAAISGTLWPDASEEHAHASLRSALARLNGMKRTVVRVTPQELELADRVVVDFRDARALAHRLINEGPSLDELNDTTISTLSLDLLPDWYDDWAVAEAEEWRQLRLHALDTLSERLIASGRFADAIGAALAAVKAEPLRETAHAILIQAHLAEGNRAEAALAYRQFRTLLHDELGVEPTAHIQALVGGLEKL